MFERRFGAYGIRRGGRWQSRPPLDNPTTIAQSKLLAWYVPSEQSGTSWPATTVGGAAIVPDLSGSNAPTLVSSGGPNDGPYVRFDASGSEWLSHVGPLGGEFDRVWIYAWIRFYGSTATNNSPLGCSFLNNLRVSSGIRGFVVTDAGSTAATDSEAIDTDWHLAVSGVDGTDQVLYVDGAKTTTANSGAMDLRVAGSEFTIGALNSAGTQAVDVDVANVVVLSAAPTAQQHDELSDWMEAA